MRSLSIFTLLVAAASMASATTVNFSCTPQNQPGINAGALVNSGSTSVTCLAGGIDVGSGNLIQNLTLNFVGSFNDSISGTNHQVEFTGTSSQGGFATTATSAGDFVGFAVVSNFVNTNPGTQTLASFVFNVTTALAGGTVSPESAAYTVSGSYTYEAQQQSGVPEPSTLALVGGVLVLAGIRKFRS